MIDHVFLPFRPRNAPVRLAELLLIALLACAIALIPEFPYDVGQGFKMIDRGEYGFSYWTVLWMDIRWNAPFVPLALLLAIIASAASNRVALHLGCATLIFGSLALFQLAMDVDSGGDLPGLPAHQILVTQWFPAWRKLLEWLLPFLFAVTVCRGQAQLGRFAFAYLAASLGVFALFYFPLYRELPDFPAVHFVEPGLSAFLYPLTPFAFGLPLALVHLFAALLMLLLSVACLRLPLQGPATRRWFGPEHGNGAEAPSIPRRTYVSALIANLSLIGLLGLGAFAVVFGHFERRFLTVFAGTEHGKPAPGLADAAPDLWWIISRDYPDLDTVARKGRPFNVVRTRTRIKIEFDSPFETYDIIAAARPDQIRQAAALIEPKQMALLDAELDPYYRAFRRAREADVLWIGEEGYAMQLNLNRLRVVARALAQRATLDSAAGRVDQCLDAVEDILCVAWLLQGQPRLVCVMSGAALRGIALSVAYNFYLFHRGEPDALAKLESTLERLRVKTRVPFPTDGLTLEPLQWPILPYAEWSAVRVYAYRQFSSKVVQYDQIMLSLALERFRRARGSYPAKLAELVPDFVSRIPKEPFEGKDYLYQNLGDEFTIRSGPLELLKPQMKSAAPIQPDLPFPQSEAFSEYIENVLHPPPAPPPPAASSAPATPVATPLSRAARRAARQGSPTP